MCVHRCATLELVLVAVLALAVACAAPDQVATTDDTPAGDEEVGQEIGDQADEVNASDSVEDLSWRWSENPDWLTEDEKHAWQAEHGDSTWVVGYFYPAHFHWPRLEEGADVPALRTG